MAVGNRAKIESLQALRALAFLGIFFLHSDFFISWPFLGVSVFFVMSGFLLFYRYHDKNMEVSPKDNFLFAVRKIGKIYPMHIITMLCLIILRFILMYRNGFSIPSFKVLLRDIVFNCTLLQAWVPRISVTISLNGVAWYLSVTLFLYFMFPAIMKTVRKCSQKRLLLTCVFLLPLEIIACILCIKISRADSQIYVWFMYYFPVFRLGEFFIGVCLGKFYLATKFNNSTVKSSLLELIFTAFTAAVFLWLKKPYSGTLLMAIHNATTAYIPLAAGWVYLFANKDGIITKLLSNKILLFIGNMSPYAFLIHSVITIYKNILFHYPDFNINAVGKILIVSIELGLSLLLSYLYKKRAGSGKPYIFF